MYNNYIITIIVIIDWSELKNVLANYDLFEKYKMREESMPSYLIWFASFYKCTRTLSIYGVKINLFYITWN